MAAASVKTGDGRDERNDRMCIGFEPAMWKSNSPPGAGRRSGWLYPCATWVATMILAAVACPVPAQSPASGQAGDDPLFEESFDGGLEGWEEQALDSRSSEFRVTTVAGDAVLAVSSEDAAGGIIRELSTGPVRASRLRWRWAVEESLAGNDRERDSGGDDYAARVLALFGSAELSEDTRALAYVWAGQEPVGSRYTNPNLSQVETLVLRSGDDRAGSWIAEERDVSADYEEAFGETAPPLLAIAVIVDTDDTDASAVAWFDDFQLWGSRVGSLDPE